MPTHSSRVLIVADEPGVTDRITTALTQVGIEPAVAAGSDEAKRRLTGESFSVAIVCTSLPNISGLELLAHARRSAPHCEVVLVSATCGREYLAEAFRLGAYDCFGAAFDAGQLVQAVLAAAREDSPFRFLTANAVRAMRAEPLPQSVPLDTVRALACAVEARDAYTRRHSEQVTHYAVSLARSMDLPRDVIHAVRLAALLHDVGKIVVPENVLIKPGPLTEEEFHHVRRHPDVGAEILKNVRNFAVEATMVRHHHENWDGSGYPDGLQGEEIPLGSRVIRVADTIDAMLMPRSYRDARSVEQMLDELARCAGKQLDPRLAAIAVQWCRANPDALILPVLTS